MNICSRHIPDTRSAPDRVAGAILLAGSLAVSGFLVPALRGGPGIAWVGWIGLLPIFITVRIVPPRAALICGALWGLCVYISAAASGHATISTSPGSLIFLTIIPATYVYLGSRVTRRIGYLPLVLAIGWMLVELVLQPVALRQGLLAGTQGDNSLVRVIGGMFGYVFVAFLIAFVNAQLLSLVGYIVFVIPRFCIFELPPDNADRIFQSSRMYPAVIPIRLIQPRAPPAAK